MKPLELAGTGGRSGRPGSDLRHPAALATALTDMMGNVLVSEVHGMAQRGGSVVSHIKAGTFAGPLVRAGLADALISWNRARPYET